MIRLILDADVPLFRPLPITSTEREIRREYALRREGHARRAHQAPLAPGTRIPSRKASRWKLLAVTGAFVGQNGNLNSL